MGCCSTKVDPQWNYHCFSRNGVVIYLMSRNGNKNETLKLSGDFERDIPWGKEIVDMQSLNDWLRNNFEKEVWPEHRKGWSQQSSAHVFQKEQCPEIYQILASFRAKPKFYNIEEKDSDWISVDGKLRPMRDVRLTAFSFVIKME